MEKPDICPVCDATLGYAFDVEDGLEMCEHCYNCGWSGDWEKITDEDFADIVYEFFHHPSDSSNLN